MRFGDPSNAEYKRTNFRGSSTKVIMQLLENYLAGNEGKLT